MNKQHLQPRLALPIPSQCLRASGCWFLHIRWCSQDRFWHCGVLHSPRGHSAYSPFLLSLLTHPSCTHRRLPLYCTQVNENVGYQTGCPPPSVHTQPCALSQTVPCRSSQAKTTKMPRAWKLNALQRISLFTYGLSCMIFRIWNLP